MWKIYPTIEMNHSFLQNTNTHCSFLLLSQSARGVGVGGWLGAWGVEGGADFNTDESAPPSGRKPPGKL